MQKLILKSLPVLLLVAVTAGAQIYKGVDSDGNVYFSDQPIEDSAKYTPQTISVVESSKAKPQEKTSEKKPAEFKYTRFDIVSPIQNEVIRNQQDASIALQIAPPLNVEQDHKVWLLMDGKPIVKDSQSMSLSIGRIDRGAHSFQAQVKDADGKIVARTRTTVAHFKYGAN